jgi:hypothetical protein
MTTIRLAINGYGLIGRQLAVRLKSEPWIKLVAINDLAPPVPAEQSLCGEGVQWLNEAAPERLPWGDLKIDVVIESARYFAREELEAQIAHSNARILMTGDLRRGLPDITLVPTVNRANLVPQHRIIGLGSDRTQCLLPLFFRLEAAFGFAMADVLLERPPYVGREWGMMFRDEERDRMSEHFDRVLPGFGSKMQFLRLESPHIKVAHFRADVHLQATPTEDQLWRVAEASEAGMARILRHRTRLRGPRLWLEGEYEPVSGYVERVIDCLAVLRSL